MFLLAMAPLSAGSNSNAPTISTGTCGKPVCTWNIFSRTYVRETSTPVTVENKFSVSNANFQYTLHVESDGVASAVISINGNSVLQPSDFTPNATVFDRNRHQLS